MSPWPPTTHCWAVFGWTNNYGELSLEMSSLCVGSWELDSSWKQSNLLNKPVPTCLLCDICLRPHDRRHICQYECFVRSKESRYFFGVSWPGKYLYTPLMFINALLDLVDGAAICNSARTWTLLISQCVTFTGAYWCSWDHQEFYLRRTAEARKRTRQIREREKCKWWPRFSEGHANAFGCHNLLFLHKS